MSPEGFSSVPFTYEFSKAPTTNYTGGNVKVADSTIFKAAKSIAVAEVTVEPGAMRELHVGLG